MKHLVKFNSRRFSHSLLLSLSCLSSLGLAAEPSKGGHIRHAPPEQALVQPTPHVELRAGNPWNWAKQKTQHYRHQRRESHIHRLDLRWYHARNAAQFRERWSLANEIAIGAVRMIEKRYGGLPSVLAGIQCLRNLSYAWGNVAEMHALHQVCEDQYAEQRHLKPIKILSPEEHEMAFNALSELFPMHPYLVERALTPSLSCSVRGGSLTAAWGFGGSIGAYRLKCVSPLGRRMLFGKLNVAGVLGFGGEVSLQTPFYENCNGSYQEAMAQVPMGAHGYKPSLITTHGVAVGLGINNYHDELANHDVAHDTTHARPEYGAGLDIHWGGGLGNLFKVGDISPDFRELFAALKLGAE